MQKILFAGALLALGVSAYAKDPNKDTIIFGATVGDHADMFKAAVQPILEAQGYQVKVIEFTDYIRPNLALASGELDVNEFQHQPYLEAFMQARGLDLSPVFQAPTAPLGIYAGRLSKLEDVKEGSTVAIPNDPSNGARALILLEEAGWITLKDEVDPLKASLKDIANNIYGLKIVELEAAQLPRARRDVDFAVITGNYATSSGINIAEALFQEQSDRFINWVVVRTDDKDAEWVQDVGAAYNSESFQTWAKENFEGYKFPLQWSE